MMVSKVRFLLRSSRELTSSPRQLRLLRSSKRRLQLPLLQSQLLLQLPNPLPLLPLNLHQLRLKHRLRRLRPKAQALLILLHSVCHLVHSTSESANQSGRPCLATGYREHGGDGLPKRSGPTGSSCKFQQPRPGSRVPL